MSREDFRSNTVSLERQLKNNTLYVQKLESWLLTEIAENLVLNVFICWTELKILRVGVEMNLT